MAKRQSKRRVGSESIQGEGSWVEIDALTVKEIKKLRKELRAAELVTMANEAAIARGEEVELEEQDTFADGLRMVERHVVGWNWVDNDGTPLPTPRSYPDVIDSLTIAEATFLADVIMGEDEESKN